MLLKLFLIIGLTCISLALATQCRDGSYCPGRQTCCLAIYGVGCCPYEDAICCGDGVHCCPNGFICGDYSCYKNSGDANLAFFLSNTKQNNFLDDQSKSSESKDNNAESAEAQSSDKINKTLINFTLNSKNYPNYSYENNNKSNNSNTKNKNLEFLETNLNNNNEGKTIINASSSTTTTTVKEEKDGLISTSIVSMSKFAAILDKFDFLNNSYFKKLLGCFTDMEPLIKDLMNAYKQRSENKTESLMKVVTQLVSKMYFDGAKITNDCKALLALAGIVGIF